MICPLESGCVKRKDIATDLQPRLTYGQPGRDSNSPVPSHPKLVSFPYSGTQSPVNLRDSMVYFTLQGFQRDSHGVSSSTVTFF